MIYWTNFKVPHWIVCRLSGFISISRVVVCPLCTMFRVPCPNCGMTRNISLHFSIHQTPKYMKNVKTRKIIHYFASLWSLSLLYFNADLIFFTFFLVPSKTFHIYYSSFHHTPSHTQKWLQLYFSISTRTKIANDRNVILVLINF